MDGATGVFGTAKGADDEPDRPRRSRACGGPDRRAGGRLPGFLKDGAPASRIFLAGVSSGAALVLSALEPEG
ncbi:hypothetical protein AB0G06_22145 [Nonomuraea dietziae]|uniref:hypothetical protein n=1 Tax=Nonomuraea dietziae TaxID=65515 RepID=UPI003406A842